MNKDFVDFSLAVKLKEKGFPLKYKFETKSWSAECKRIVVLPNIYKVFKWLRDVKKIYVSILPFATHSTINKVAFYYLIEYNSTGETITSIEPNNYYVEWEDAALAGIKYVCENLI